MIIMGLDPAFSNVGYSLAEYDVKTGNYDVIDIGLIQTKKAPGKQIRKNSDDLRRAREINGELLKIIESAEVKYIMAEVPQGTQSARASWALGIVVGILGCLPVPMIQLTPLQVKQFIGNKNASKQEMIDWAMTRHPRLEWATRMLHGRVVPINAKNEHMADSVAVLEAGFETQQWLEAREMIAALL